MKSPHILRLGAMLLLLVLSISSKSFANPCSVAISVSPAGPFPIAGGGGSSSFIINTGGNGTNSCHWTITASSFIHPSLLNGGGGSTFQFSVNFTVDANPNLAARSGSIVVTQTEDSTSKTLIINQAAATGDFSLGVAPGSQGVISGGSTTYNLTMSRSGGFAGAISFPAPSGLPSGASASFVPNNTTGTSSVMTITTSGTTPAGTYPIIISGVNGTVTHTVSATLIVSPGVAHGLTTAVNPVANTMDVDYVATDGHVYRFFYNGIWHIADLSALTGTSNASLTGGIKTTFNTISSTMEVHYISTDGHVHTLSYNGAWNHTDLTNATGGALAATNSSISAGMNPIANVEEVEYIGTDHHVYQFWYNGTWHSADLTTLSGAVANADSSSGINNIMNTIGNAMEVEYIGTDHHVYALWYPLGGGGLWHASDLTLASGNPNAVAGSPLTSSMDPIANTEDLDYIGADHHVYELWYNGLWHPADVTTLSGAVANADSSSGIHTLMNTIANAMEVHYIGTDHHPYSLWYPLGGGGAWHATDLTVTNGAPQAKAGSPLTSSADSVANTVDLEYVGSDQHVYRLSYNGIWNITDLTATAVP
jgi:hypothetical protein